MWRSYVGEIVFCQDHLPDGPTATAGSAPGRRVPAERGGDPRQGERRGAHAQGRRRHAGVAERGGHEPRGLAIRVLARAGRVRRRG
ncbi:hypothetical protein DZG03_16260, partial [Clavibacter phaseoli]